MELQWKMMVVAFCFLVYPTFLFIFSCIFLVIHSYFQPQYLVLKNKPEILQTNKQTKKKTKKHTQNWRTLFWRWQTLLGIPRGLSGKEIYCLPVQGTWVQSLGREDPLKEEMTTHSSILTGKNPMGRGAWWDIVHGITESDTSEWQSTHTNTHKQTLLKMLEKFTKNNYSKICLNFLKGERIKALIILELFFIETCSLIEWFILPFFLAIL